MTYLIKVIGWNTKDGDAPENYSVFDYLPLTDNGDWAFQTAEEAGAYIIANHKGPDCDGVEPRFQIVEAA